MKFLHLLLKFIQNLLIIRNLERGEEMKNIDEMGVPQGTIFLLFIIYINELLKLMPLNLISYADDTVITYSSKS